MTNVDRKKFRVHGQKSTFQSVHGPRSVSAFYRHPGFLAIDPLLQSRRLKELVIRSDFQDLFNRFFIHGPFTRI